MNASADQGGPVLNSVDFWYKMLFLMVSVIEEDKNTYTPVLNQLVNYCFGLMYEVLTQLYFVSNYVKGF